jgi:hypothetical protein
MSPLHLEPLAFREIATIEIHIEEQQQQESVRHTFGSLPEVPERFPPAFGMDQKDSNMLYLGNRVREAYEARQRESVFREPYSYTAADGARHSVSRVVTVKITYTRLRQLQ